MRRRTVLGAAAALALAGTRPGRAEEGPMTPAQLRAKYAQPPSRFVTVDGVDLHVREEGSGPPLLMLNGHLGNLHMYDAWAVRLGARFRTVRVDWPPYGLSLPDPSGVYSTDRAVDLLRRLLDGLGYAKIMAVGTSNGATVAAHLAVRDPGRVERLALSTVPLGVPGPREVAPQLKEQMALYGKNDTYRPRSYYRAVLEDIFYDPKNVSDPLVEQYTDLNNYPGGYAAVDEYIRTNIAMYKSGRLPGFYAGIAAPVLVQWGDGGKVLPPAAADDAVAAFPGAKVVLKRYPKSGHMPMLEQPEPTGADLLAFLTGGLDKDARPPVKG